jgi:uncharacterized protein with GYD domain
MSSESEPVMNQYVLLSKLTSEGARSLWAQPRRIQEVNEEIEEYGCQVISQFATLGPYDFVTVIEAPDNQAVLRLSAMLGSRGTMQIVSMPAVWVGDFLEGVQPRPNGQDGDGE